MYFINICVVYKYQSNESDKNTHKIASSKQTYVNLAWFIYDGSFVRTWSNEKMAQDPSNKFPPKTIYVPANTEQTGL